MDRRSVGVTQTGEDLFRSRRNKCTLKPGQEGDPSSQKALLWMTAKNGLGARTRLLGEEDRWPQRLTVTRRTKRASLHHAHWRGLRASLTGLGVQESSWPTIHARPPRLVYPRDRDLAQRQSSSPAAPPTPPATPPPDSLPPLSATATNSPATPSAPAPPPPQNKSPDPPASH